MPPPNDPGAILRRLETFGVKLGLERMRLLLAELGDPQRRLPAVLVAGSNGKGSTSALLAAMASAGGYRTGLYTSPHLESVEERLRIDGRAVPLERLGGLLDRVVGAAERATGEPPTYFEALTAAAFLWMAAEEVELAVLEVGMGGRLDATNTADPVLSLVTSISLEHREHLGDTLAAIAREKAGILRPGRPALAWVEEPEALAAIREVAAEVGADLGSAAELVRVESRKDMKDGQRVHLTTPAGSYHLATRLVGPHQVRNLGLAVLAAEALAGLGWPRLDAAAVAMGAARCRWPGRLETIVLPGGRRVLLDAAHNPEASQVLAAWLERLGEPYDLLFGVLGDKEVSGMLAPLARRARRVLLTTPASDRARPASDLRAWLPEGVAATIEPELGIALERGLAPGAPTLVACGSIYLIGAVRRLLRERYGVPEPATAPLW